MAHIVKEKLFRRDDAHALLQAIYTTEVDLLPNQAAGVLTVRLHHLANRATDEVIRHLCNELNSTETIFPGTNLRITYELVS